MMQPSGGIVNEGSGRGQEPGPHARSGRRAPRACRSTGRCSHHNRPSLARTGAGRGDSPGLCRSGGAGAASASSPSPRNTRAAQHRVDLPLQVPRRCQRAEDGAMLHRGHVDAEIGEGRHQRRSNDPLDASGGRHTAAAQKKPAPSDSVACASAATGSPSIGPAAARLTGGRCAEPFAHSREVSPIAQQAAGDSPPRRAE